MNRLEPLNNYLEGQKKGQRVVVYAIVVIFILVFGYLLFLDDNLTELSNKTQELENKELLLRKSVRNSAMKKIEALRKNLKKSKDEIQKKTQENANYKPNVEDSSLFSINDSNFAMFLESALAKSKDLNISLIKVDIFSDKLPYIGYLEIKKRLKFHGQGKFLDILRLARYMENQNFLIKLKKFEIKKPDVREKDTKVDKEKKSLDPKHVIFDSTFEIMGATL